MFKRSIEISTGLDCRRIKVGIYSILRISLSCVIISSPSITSTTHMKEQALTLANLTL